MSKIFKKVHRIVVLETGTCCEIAARHLVEKFKLLPAPQFLTQPSFFAGLQWMRKNATEDDIILLPHVNDSVLEATLQKGFYLDGTLLFSLMNPKLYLAEGDTKLATHSARCATLPSLQPLVIGPAFTTLVFDFLSKTNTQEAARAARDGEAAYCITNEYGLRKYKLKPVRELKPMEIVWLSFRYSRPKN